MLLPQVWDRCYQWVESTTTWRNARDRELTHVYLAGQRSGNPESSQHAINGYLAALEGKCRELGRLIDSITGAYDELIRADSANPLPYAAHQIQDEKDSILALLKLVDGELENQTRDWQGELQALSGPQKEPAESPLASFLEPFRALLASFSQPRNRRAMSYGLQIPRLRLRRGRKRGSTNKNN